MKKSDFTDLDWAEDFTTLEAGQMIIWSDALRALDEHIEHLALRAKYYEEFPKTEEDFLDCLDDLSQRIRQIRRTNQGER